MSLPGSNPVGFKNGDEGDRLPDLASLSSRIDILLKSIQESARPDGTNGVQWDSFAKETERFLLWADNLGLNHLGHSSLDYRFRDAENLVEFVKGLLADLCAVLENVLSLFDPSALKGLPASDAATGRDVEQFDIDTEELDLLDDSDNLSEADVLLSEFVDINSNLYKFATRLRNPKTRQLPPKAAHFAQIDPDTGVDLIQRFEEVDRAHILELIKHYRTPKDSKWHAPIEISEDEVRLVSRLAKANTRRRQNFGYWKEHCAKRSAETRRIRANADRRALSPGQVDPLAPKLGGLAVADVASQAYSRPTTATHLLNPGAIRLDDETASTVTGCSAAPEPKTGDDDDVNIPDPPKSLKDSVCPYCFTVCSPSVLRGRRWREHVIRDLRPFICTYGGCKEENELFDNWKDWSKHEQWSHNRVWRCPEHRKSAFASIGALQKHFEHAHGNVGLSLGEVVSLGAEVSAEFERGCPFCLCTEKTLDALQRHIAIHLQRISLFALPRSVATDQNSSHGSIASARVNLASGASSHLLNLDSTDRQSAESDLDRHKKRLERKTDALISEITAWQHRPPNDGIRRFSREFSSSIGELTYAIANHTDEDMSGLLESLIATLASTLQQLLTKRRSVGSRLMALDMLQDLETKLYSGYSNAHPHVEPADWPFTIKEVLVTVQHEIQIISSVGSDNRPFDEPLRSTEESRHSRGNSDVTLPSPSGESEEDETGPTARREGLILSDISDLDNDIERYLAQMKEAHQRRDLVAMDRLSDKIEDLNVQRTKAQHALENVKADQRRLWPTVESGVKRSPSPSLQGLQDEEEEWQDEVEEEVEGEEEEKDLSIKGLFGETDSPSPPPQSRPLTRHYSGERSQFVSPEGYLRPPDSLDPLDLSGERLYVPPSASESGNIVGRAPAFGRDNEEIYEEPDDIPEPERLRQDRPADSAPTPLVEGPAVERRRSRSRSRLSEERETSEGSRRISLRRGGYVLYDDALQGGSRRRWF